LLLPLSLPLLSLPLSLLLLLSLPVLRRHPERSEGSLYLPSSLFVLLFVIPKGSAAVFAFAVAFEGAGFSPVANKIKSSGFSH
jgi:hypothetical protein